MANEVYASIGSGGSTFLYEETYRRANNLPIDFGLLFVTAMDYDPVTLQKTVDTLGLSDGQIVHVNHRDYRYNNGKLNPHAYGKMLIEEAQKRGVTKLFQNGATPMTPDEVLLAFDTANQHPVPAHEIGGAQMYGTAPHEVVRRFAQHTGRFHTYASVHTSTPVLDKGDYLRVSGAIPFAQTDTAEQIQNRVKPIEWQLCASQLEAWAFGTSRTITVRNLLAKPGEEALLYGLVEEVRQEYRTARKAGATH